MKSKYLDSLRKNIGTYLKDKEWKPGQLAKKINMDPSQFKRFMDETNADANPTLETLVRLGEQMGKSPSQLLNDEMTAPTSPTIEGQAAKITEQDTKIRILEAKLAAMPALSHLPPEMIKLLRQITGAENINYLNTVLVSLVKRQSPETEAQAAALPKVKKK